MEQDKQLFYQNLSEKAETNLLDKEKELALLILKQAQINYYQHEDYHKEIYGLLERMNKAANFSFQPLVNVARKWLGDDTGSLFQYIVDQTVNYPYSVGYYRRPFRTSNLKLHFEGVLNKLLGILELSRQSFHISEYLSGKGEWGYNTVISDIISYELDRGNIEVFQALKEIIYGDNNVALLNKWMIEGILRSHNQEAYKMLGELLLAARLQEGLRQSIVESMDEGTIEATLYLLNIIIEHDLIRYSSVIRALDVWTGLNLEAVNKRVANQCIQYVCLALTDRAAREEWMNSKNVNQLYISLWATAVYEEDDIGEKVGHLMEQGELYQKIVAQSLLTQSQNDKVKYEISQKYLAETDRELQYYILLNYTYECSCWSNSHERKITYERIPVLEDKNERSRQFLLFKEILSDMPKKELTFTSKVFEGKTINFTTDMIAEKLIYLIAYDMDQEWIEQLISFKDKVSSDVRNTLLLFFTKDLTNKTQRNYIFDCLTDKSIHNRERAMVKISAMELLDDEVEKIEGILKLKTGTLRQKAIQILLLQKNEQFEQSIDRLLESKFELQRLGALEVLSELKENSDRFDTFSQKVNIISNPTEKEQILINKLKKSDEKGLKNGFGLYNPDQKAVVPLQVLPIVKLSDVFTLTIEEVIQFSNGLSDLIHENRHYEYQVEYYDGSKETLLLGSELRFRYNKEIELKRIDTFPLSDVWKNYLNEKGITSEQIIQIQFLLTNEEPYLYYSDKLNYWQRERFPALNSWRKTFLSKVYPIEEIEQVQSFLNKLDYNQQVCEIVDAFFDDMEKSKAFEVMSEILYSMIHVIPEEKRQSEDKLLAILVKPWLRWTEQFIFNDESFKIYFPVHYHLYTVFKYEDYNPSLEKFTHAYELCLIDKDELYRELLSRKSSREHFRNLTGQKSDLYDKYPSIIPIKERVIETILDIELNRGELPTDVTTLAGNIRSYEGIEYFVKILVGMDKESFVRGYIYSFYGEATKKETFSHLLKACYPMDGEDEKLLEQLLKGKKLSEKRLLEAAMYAPQWLEIVSKYLKWDGLRSAAWYFHAHINETFSAEKETIIAHFSPIKPEEFNDGAFDIAWFKSAYKEIGEKRFKVLYDCAKYISGGGNHRRSQLFADATLGKLKLSDLKKSVIDKRNKDHLLCYSLIPIDKENERDVLDRYEFLQTFLKESKKFGAQRRASESKVVGIALENLARNAGYKDVIRLNWEMEAKKMEEIKPYLESKEIGEITLQLVIDENGKADILVSKNGKSLKSIPSKYNKNEYVIELKAVKTDLTNQYKRAKEVLERSMERQDSFKLDELTKMMKNPVISPLLEVLVFRLKEHLGYFVDGKLVSIADRGDYSIDANDEILIAHPFDLYDSGQWSEYQRDLFTRKIKQPFKQVFRELYIPNQDELDAGTASMRYAGHQVQPRKTVSLLKNRNWTVSYEEGLQKVFYKENIIAKIYAMADWFSPSDVESPTLETVEFLDRHTYKNIELKNVPKLLFSETMRDVDLVVSVAHVGGVDPEASLTTIEMRRAIVTESIRLMKLDNVRVEGNFALIEGQLGEYSVHLGSANAYKQASGALFIVPVHSQHRGRIFLPFMDEDPRTAEIVSKILMLAQDQKIKDPYILEQIK